MVDMKEPKFFFGINIERKNNIITLDEGAYLPRDSNAVSNPLPEYVSK